MARQMKKETAQKQQQAQPENLGIRFALIYFAILFAMTFVFLAAPPAHSAPSTVELQK